MLNPRATRRGPQPIGDILSQVMARRGLARVQSGEAFASAWKTAAGDLLAGYSRAGQVRRGVLDVIVANSVLVQELTFRKAALLADLGRLLPDERIVDVKFRVGPID
jgi:predicted nucleic acid-binding Zn ribbon protein